MRIIIPLPDTHARAAAVARVGGITVVRRLVRLAECAGYEPIVVQATPDDAILREALEGTCAVLEQDVAQEDVDGTLVLDPTFLPRPDWLAAVRRGEADRAVPLGDSARDADERRHLENTLIRGLVQDTGGFMSRNVERPLSRSVTRQLMNTAITPNQMTWISLAIGLLGAACFAVPGRGWAVAGALLFLLHSILDGCDGELARLKLQERRWGGVLDFWDDHVVHAAVFLGIGIGWSRSEGGVLPLLLAGMAIFGTFVSAGLIYQYTMRRSSGTGSLCESVSREAVNPRQAKIADALARRDFIYLVVLLAVVGQIHVFLALSALAAPAYAVTLLAIRRASR